MSSIEQIQRDIAKTKNIKEKLNSIINTLSLVAQDAENLNKEIKSRYLINGNPAPISDSVSSLKGDIKKTRDYLKTVIKPALDSSISNFQKAKTKLENEND